MSEEIQESFEKTRVAGSVASGALDEISKIINEENTKYKIFHSDT